MQLTHNQGIKFSTKIFATKLVPVVVLEQCFSIENQAYLGFA